MENKTTVKVSEHVTKDVFDIDLGLGNSAKIAITTNDLLTYKHHIDLFVNDAEVKDIEVRDYRFFNDALSHARNIARQHGEQSACDKMMKEKHQQNSKVGE